MHTRPKAVTLAAVAGLTLSLASCAQVANLKAMKKFKEANALYRQQEYKRAAAKYEEATQENPDMITVYFYLGNSYDNLYKPGRRGEAENDNYLTKAVENYKIAAEREQDPKMKKLALEYLVAAYGPDKLADPSQAEPVVQRMIELDPAEPRNYFALAKIYEDAGQYDQAEAMFLKARDAKPNDAEVYMQLAGYYNRQGEFDKTIDALEQRAAKEPNNPEAFYTISTYYWDKAYRDFRLKDVEKRGFVLKGIDAIDRALQIKADYMEALVYKNLLLRLQANTEKDPATQQALIKQADQLRDRAQELRKLKVAGVGG